MDLDELFYTGYMDDPDDDWEDEDDIYFDEEDWEDEDDFND